MSVVNVVKDWTTAAGYRAAIIKHSSLGHLCGYVGVPKGHPLYGKNYYEHIPYLSPSMASVMDSPIGKRGMIPAVLRTSEDRNTASMDIVFNVHGSITYSRTDPKYPVESDLHWIGFDCGHYSDTPDVCNENYVTKECESLASQILNCGKPAETKETPVSPRKSTSKRAEVTIVHDTLQEISGNLTSPEIRVWCHPHIVGKSGDDYYEKFDSFAEAELFIKTCKEAEPVPLIALGGYEINIYTLMS